MKNPKPENRNPKFATAPCAVRSVLECGRARGASGNRSADFQSAVSRVSNPQAPRKLEDDREFNALPTGSRRNSRLETCATVAMAAAGRTAGWQPAVSRIANPQAPRQLEGNRPFNTLPTGSRRHSRLETCATRWRPSRRMLALGFLCSLLCLPALAQYAIDWHTMDGGGGTSTGGVYAVSGTIGQPDAGVMSGGLFTLHGGFWGIVAAIQTPGAPYLTVWRTATNTVVVSWPLAGAAGWVLQATNALPTVSAPWPQIPPPYQTNAGVISVTVTNVPPTGSQFYRLHKP